MKITFCVVFPAESFTVDVLSLFPLEILVFKDYRSFWLALDVNFCLYFKTRIELFSFLSSAVKGNKFPHALRFLEVLLALRLCQHFHLKSLFNVES